MTRKASTASTRRPQAHALHIGINEVSAAHYAGWTGPLAACEFDAHDMAAISKSAGMKSTVLLTRKATRASVLAALRKAARALGAGDLFFMSYSGHGGQVPDVSGEEPDKLDETWCLFDGQLIDDELYYELSLFKAGVRVLVLSDSCHSGTVVRAARPAPGTPEQRPRIMPRAVGLRVYAEHKAFYDKLQADVAKAAGGAVDDPDTALANVTVSPRLTAIVKEFHPAVILISGCQDNQFSMDGNHNGAFTEQLLGVWNNGSFKGSYASLHARVRAGLPPTQSPNLFTLGPAAAFLKQQPFSV
ncbi:MAG: caspase family protein [Hydrogenophaga sp.]|jgi:metacaspase-1|uniref:caspase family protein n=1 Tax=Hydrogenophaga sp. TaxID=1904254 RepID=UPI00261A412F|nr:caspase family protein [Hydrogenophaga sp.]MCV0440159.1 caspase family protein [Hydrogenophaga sp.]